MDIESADEFVRLRSSGDPAMQQLAAHASAKAEVWMDVIERYPNIRFWVAQNKTVPLEVIRKLASDSDYRVRSMIAVKNRTPLDVLEELSRDPDPAVRADVAWNKKTPIDVRRKLLSDPEEIVRDAATRRLALAKGGNGV